MNTLAELVGTTHLLLFQLVVAAALTGIIWIVQLLVYPQFLNVDARGFIPVDSSMATSLPGVWAAGDVAAFPLQGFSEERVTIGHWGLAMYLGKTAALAMLGRQVSSC